MADQKERQKLSLEDLRSYASRNGFIYQSSEIYGGFAATYDYGHYGYLLKKNIEEAWMKSMLKHKNIKALDSAIFMDPRVWKASGHVDSFDDPMLECKNCNNRMRADHLLEKHDIEADDKWPIEKINEELDKLKDAEVLKCDSCGSDDLTEAKSFNLLVQSNLGNTTGDFTPENSVYLRGETCQGIYLNYNNYVKSLRCTPPFGIAQVGKAFRNEIVARQFAFRTREFEQMEMQLFVHPDNVEKYYSEWKDARIAWVSETLGIPMDYLRYKKHDQLSHYASEAYDIEYNFRSLGGFKEIEGVHARGDWDLSQHMKHSDANLTYYDQKTEERYTPNVVEVSAGLTRQVMAVLDYALTQETLEDGSERTVLKLKPSIAPIKAAIFPLTKDEKLTKIADSIYTELSDSDIQTEYDEKGSIGKRYRRQDEVGTPYCITVDFDSLDDDCVTIRDRDTLEQERVKINALSDIISEKISN